jgi:hypothetical protein
MKPAGPAPNPHEKDRFQHGFEATLGQEELGGARLAGRA